MSSSADNLDQITDYLKRLSGGDASAESLLADAVYVQMQRIARAIVQGKPSDFTLQATELVNQVLLELVRVRSIDWQDRAHFFRVAARLLRRRFIDYVRSQRAAKRPPKQAKIGIDDVILPAKERFDEIILVHEGLQQLADFDPALAELVELVYFGGIPIAMVAEIRGVSEKTIDRHLDLARRWLEKKFRTACPAITSSLASSNGT